MVRGGTVMEMSSTFQLIEMTGGKMIGLHKPPSAVTERELRVSISLQLSDWRNFNEFITLLFLGHLVPGTPCHGEVFGWT